jgi:hypothetical protein
MLTTIIVATDLDGDREGVAFVQATGECEDVGQDQHPRYEDQSRARRALQIRGHALPFAPDDDQHGHGHENRHASTKRGANARAPAGPPCANPHSDRHRQQRHDEELGGSGAEGQAKWRPAIPRAGAKEIDSEVDPQGNRREAEHAGERGQGYRESEVRAGEIAEDVGCGSARARGDDHDADGDLGGEARPVREGETRRGQDDHLTHEPDHGRPRHLHHPPEVRERELHADADHDQQEDHGDREVVPLPPDSRRRIHAVGA